MDEKTGVGIDREYYINEATLDYLRRRIEGDVKGNFFRWIGLPVGGAGIVAIILTLFFWIPGKIDTIIESNPVVQKTLDESARNYLNDPEKGQQFIINQVKTETEQYLKDPQRGQIIIKEQIENTARTQIETITAEFFKSTGEAMIRDLADSYLKSQAVHDILINAINNALKPKIASLSKEIRQNTEKLVIETAMPSHDTQRIDKGTLGMLSEFLGSEEARKLKREKRPVVLAFTVRQGKRYVGRAVDFYLNDLEDFFGQAFNSVLVLDSDGTFIAKLEPSFVRSNIDPLIKLFNSDPQVQRSKIKEKLEQMHGAYCTACVRSHWKVFEALTNPIWRKETDLDEEVPVLDENMSFIGLTSRNWLIKGMLG